MRGISDHTREILGKLVEEMFDRVSHHLLGDIPALKNKKVILFTTKPNQTLAHLFVQSMGESHPLPQEQSVLKNLLNTAHTYIEALKSKTKANLVESIDAYVKESRAKLKSPSDQEIRAKVLEQLAAAGSHLKTIAEAEGTKARNMGKLMQIARVGASTGQADPMVFFITMKDADVCKECQRLHLLDDRITPRVWKMSELGYTYHKKGQPNPKVMGLHPHCRCTLSLLTYGFGFNSSGNVAYMGPDHNEFKKQRGND